MRRSGWMAVRTASAGVRAAPAAPWRQRRRCTAYRDMPRWGPRWWSRDWRWIVVHSDPDRRRSCCQRCCCYLEAEAARGAAGVAVAAVAVGGIAVAVAPIAVAAGTVAGGSANWSWRSGRIALPGRRQPLTGLAGGRAWHGRGGRRDRWVDLLPHRPFLHWKWGSTLATVCSCCCGSWPDHCCCCCYCWSWQYWCCRWHLYCQYWWLATSSIADFRCLSCSAHLPVRFPVAQLPNSTCRGDARWQYVRSETEK